jgi:hypothetical protein
VIVEISFQSFQSLGVARISCLTKEGEIAKLLLIKKYCFDDRVKIDAHMITISISVRKRFVRSMYCVEQKK